MRALVLCCLAALAAPVVAQEAPRAVQARPAQRGYIGIRPAEISQELRQHYKIAEGIDRGLVLTQIFEKSPAAKAGLRVGDVLTSFDNKPVNSIDELIKLLDGMKPGRRVAYVARRGSGTIAGLLVLAKQPVDTLEEAPKPVREPKAAPKAAPGAASGHDLDKRMDKLNREIEALRERAEKRKAAARAKGEKGKRAHVAGAGLRIKRPAPRNIVGWMEIEEERIVAAKKSRNERAVGWHMARMQMLRELREAGYNTPNAESGRHARRDARGAPEHERERGEMRMRMLEKRREEVLERL